MDQGNDEFDPALTGSENDAVQRMAWIVLIVSFVVFCGLTTIGTRVLYAFLVESTVPMATVLDVGRGTVVASRSDTVLAVRETLDITGSIVTLSTDSQSQATVSFYSQQNPAVLLANLTLKAGSSLQIRPATQPRFTGGAAGYTVNVARMVGEVDLLVNDVGDRQLSLSVAAEDGQRVSIDSRGRYTISASASIFRVISFEGEAIVFNRDPLNNAVIPAGLLGVVYTNRPDIGVTEAPRSIVENGLFSLASSTSPPDMQRSGTYLPERWGCVNVQEAPPRGIYESVEWDGRSALRMARGDGARSHGETRCQQPIDVQMQDVSDFSYLEIISSFRIEYQSLSECGVEGSECPVMLLVQYTDVHGTSQSWYQGFFATTTDQSGFPLRCDSCTQEHQRVNNGVWFTYESGNIFASFPADKRPAAITNVEVYSSGHEYDVLVSEVAILVGYSDIFPASVFDAVPTG
jgi:hypothetical protein